MQILDKVIWDRVVDNAAKKAFQGIVNRPKSWRHKRMDAALRQALKDLNVTLAELP